MNKENSINVEKEQFTVPVIEIIELEMADIITTSGSTESYEFEDQSGVWK